MVSVILLLAVLWRESVLWEQMYNEGVSSEWNWRAVIKVDAYLVETWQGIHGLLNSWLLGFLLCDAYMQCIVHLCCWQRLSHAGIVSKLLKISSNCFLAIVALPLGYLILHYCCEILTGRGACHSGGLGNFQSDKNAEQWQCCMTRRPADTFTPSACDTGCRYFPPSRWYRIMHGFLASAELLV